ncbi:MAG TPA: dTMP kinase [Nevskiaceae bacterium]|nr:dTMP kinase [Nevskiaceae bacterium]
MTPPGRLITLEGGEGAGKSTHAKHIAEWLRTHGRRVLETREPGGTPSAEALRKVFLGEWPEGMDAKTETLVVFAARAVHWRTTIQPALAAGSDVVCDRFVDASYAYQGAGRGAASDILATLEQWILGDRRPDLTLVFDIDPAQGLARTRRRGTENRFEHERLAFLQRVREAYLVRARLAPSRYQIIDAGQPLAVVERALVGALEECL